jgi:predicted enzyme related to lactoylglutathione lyase
MVRHLVLLALLFAAGATLSAQAPIVFFDIAGPDSSRLQKFYADLFEWKATATGTFTAPASTPLPATFRGETAEIVIYIGVTDIAATLTRVQAAGGSVVFPRLVVPGTAVIGLFKDPAGTRVGLVEIENGKPKVP